MTMVSLLVYIAVTLIVLISATVAVLFLLLHCKPVLLYNMLARYDLFKIGMKVKYIKAGDLTYCYAEKGKGKSTKPSMLFLHGITGSKSLWLDMIKELPEDLHIILVDMPGHGGTSQKLKSDHSYDAQAKRIHQFVESYGLNKSPFHIIGASMGGGVAGVYAAFYPKDLVKLTLICPAGITTPKLSGIVMDIRAGKTNALIPRTVEELKALMRNSMYNERSMPDWVYRMVFEVQKTNSTFFENVLADITQCNNGLQKRLPEIETSTQVIWGIQDKFVDVSGVDVLRSDMKTLERVDMISECGHTVSMDRPVKAAQVLNDFIYS